MTAHVPHGHQKSSKANLVCKFSFSHNLSPIPELVPGVPQRIRMQRYQEHESLVWCLLLPLLLEARELQSHFCRSGHTSDLSSISWAAAERDVALLSRQRQQRAWPWAPEERAAMVSPHISLHYQTMLPLTLRAWRARAKTANLAASKEAREGF